MRFRRLWDDLGDVGMDKCALMQRLRIFERIVEFIKTYLIW